jgi:hypothetical protein
MVTDKRTSGAGIATRGFTGRDVGANPLEECLLTDYNGGVQIRAHDEPRRPRNWPAPGAPREIPRNLHAESLSTAGVAHISDRPTFWPLRQELTRHVRIVRSFTAHGERLASHRDGRGAPLARRDDREYREYLSEEQRSQRGCIASRMQPDFHHGLPTSHTRPPSRTRLRRIVVASA